MPNIQNRQIGEGAAHPDATKENATAGNRGADKTNLTDHHSTVEHPRETERGLYLPLAWAQLGNAVKPAKFRGKNKRKTRADAIRAKRSMGHMDLQLAGWLVLAVVSALMLIGGAR